jgi:hypothetical protein
MCNKFQYLFHKCIMINHYNTAEIGPYKKYIQGYIFFILYIYIIKRISFESSLVITL